MEVLAIDTTNTYCSVALISGGVVLESIRSSSINQQAEILFNMIEELLAQNHLNYNNLQGIIVTKGPGSFTGIRIGMAAAKGISLAADINLFGVSTLEVMAFTVTQNNPNNKNNIQVILDAGFDRAYHQVFSHNLSPITDPEIVTKNAIDIDDYLVASNIDGYGTINPDAIHAGLLAYRKLQTKEKMTAEPLYLR